MRKPTTLLASARHAICLLVLIALFAPGMSALAEDANDFRKSPAAESSEQKSPSDVILGEFTPKLDQLQSVIEKHEKDAKERILGSADTQQAIDTLEKTRPALEAIVNTLTPQLKEAQAQLAKLGPPPKDDAKEPDAIAAQRKEITGEVGAYDGLIKRAEVMFVQAGQTITAYNSMRRKRFLSGLLRRSDNLENFNFWQSAGAAAMALAQDVAGRLSRLSQALAAAWPRTVFGVIIVLGLTFLLSALSRQTSRHRSFASLNDDSRPTRSERGAIVLRSALSVSLPVVLGLVALYLVSSAIAGLRPDSLRLLAQCSVYLGVGIFLISAVHFALLPADPRERLVLMDDRAARAIATIAKIFVAVWVIDQLFEIWDQELGSPLSLVIARTCLFGVVYGLLIAAFIAVRIRRPNAHPSTRRTNGWPRWMFAILAAWAVAVIVSALLGYVSLARFMGAQFIATGGLVFFVTIVHLTAEYLSAPLPPPEDAADDDQRQTMFGATIGVLAGLALDMLVLLIGLPLLLLQWGYDWAEVRGWVSSAFFGFQIGSLRISMLQILIAIAIFVIGLILTRVVRNMFMRRSTYMFSDTSGVRKSLATMLGYVGSVLSLVAALGYLGMEVSNLALIAGALSVGIGFGLQSIANNFVSGLILLAERPIKVGDWIIVGDQQGRVQKISVRSTQIRTFDRSTLIVPNADMITNQVINWDHGDTVGRITIPVGVSYNSDPRLVLKLLMSIGRSHPKVVSGPRSPLVVFENFGDSSLDFSLRVHLRNIRDFQDVQTEMRVQIVEVFRENGIEIPFPQRDLHIIKQEHEQEHEA